MTNLTARLSDEEIDRLATFLARVVGGDIPNIEAFDGFITALAVCPEMIAPANFCRWCKAAHLKTAIWSLTTTAKLKNSLAL